MIEPYVFFHCGGITHSMDDISASTYLYDATKGQVKKLAKLN